MCLRHNEAKHTRTLEFGAEEVLLQGPARRRVAHALKAPKSLKGFSKAFLFLLLKKIFFKSHLDFY